MIALFVTLFICAEIAVRVQSSEPCESPITASNGHLWTECVVPYVIDGPFNFAEKQIIQSAIIDIEQVSTSCVHFVQHTAPPFPPNYLIIKNGVGCQSAVGNLQNGPQDLVLDQNQCMNKPDVTRQLMKAVGFHPEHQRSDRGNKVTINFSNIATTNQSKFCMLHDVTNYGTPYDFQSILHFKKNAYAVNPSIDTIYKTQEPSAILGGDVLSDGDKAKLTAVYPNP